LISMIKNNMIQYYVDREFGGGKLAMERSQALTNSADLLYKRAGSMRKEAAALSTPRRI
jgi:hypothetical protein